MSEVIVGDRGGWSWNGVGLGNESGGWQGSVRGPAGTRQGCKTGFDGQARDSVLSQPKLLVAIIF
jgi:hypothetical protein